MACLPVHGDNPGALVSGLSNSCIQVDKHGITNFTSYTCVDLVHHEICRVKLVKVV